MAVSNNYEIVQSHSYSNDFKCVSLYMVYSIWYTHWYPPKKLPNISHKISQEQIRAFLRVWVWRSSKIVQRSHDHCHPLPKIVSWGWQWANGGETGAKNEAAFNKNRGNDFCLPIEMLSFLRTLIWVWMNNCLGSTLVFGGAFTLDWVPWKQQSNSFAIPSAGFWQPFMFVCSDFKWTCGVWWFLYPISFCILYSAKQLWVNRRCIIDTKYISEIHHGHILDTSHK